MSRKAIWVLALALPLTGVLACGSDKGDNVRAASSAEREPVWEKLSPRFEVLYEISGDVPPNDWAGFVWRQDPDARRWDTVWSNGESIHGTSFYQSGFDAASPAFSKVMVVCDWSMQRGESMARASCFTDVPNHIGIIATLLRGLPQTVERIETDGRTVVGRRTTCNILSGDYVVCLDGEGVPLIWAGESIDGLQAVRAIAILSNPTDEFSLDETAPIGERVAVPVETLRLPNSLSAALD